ncbi:MAG: hypothetical protein NTZ78_00780, partial [Candidatus Aureabacteria bacterium]|nr:hypothetical protein [Candidatus Auribacterota bacterium]
CGMVVAGSVDTPGIPSAGSGMYTLQNLYDYLTSGTVLTVQSGFQEPSAAPGSTMKTMKEIGDAIKDNFNLCAATADNVEQGVTFFCTQPGSWGVQTGTLSALPRPTATPTITPTPTPTPTITPTSTPEWCAAAGGHWGLDRVGTLRCWIEGGVGLNCTDACVARGLNCATDRPNDLAGCDNCRFFEPTAGCVTHGDCTGPYAPWYRGASTNCVNNKDGCTSTCSAVPDGEAGGRNICVCIQ